MPDRQDPWDLVCEYTRNINLRRHMLAVEAGMRAYARRFGEDEELWGLVGLETPTTCKPPKIQPSRLLQYPSTRYARSPATATSQLAAGKVASSTGWVGWATSIIRSPF